MSKLLSKLRKNENNTDIPLYQIYLPQLHENIWKYYWLDSFDESPLVSNTASRRLQNLLQVILTCFT